MGNPITPFITSVKDDSRFLSNCKRIEESLLVKGAKVVGYQIFEKEEKFDIQSSWLDITYIHEMRQFTMRKSHKNNQYLRVEICKSGRYSYKKRGLNERV